MLIPPTNLKILVSINNSNSEENMCSHHTFDFSKGDIVEYLYISIPPSKYFIQNVKKWIKEDY